MSEQQGKSAVVVLWIIASLLADGWAGLFFAVVAVIWAFLP